MPALTVEPETIQESSVFRTLATTDSGSLRRRNVYPAGKKSRKRYSLGWSVASEATLDAIDSLIRSVKAAGTFTWTPPGGTQGDFMLIEDSVSITRSSALAGSIQFTIEEV